MAGVSLMRWRVPKLSLDLSLLLLHDQPQIRPDPKLFLRLCTRFQECITGEIQLLIIVSKEMEVKASIISTFLLNLYLIILHFKYDKLLMHLA